MNKKELIRKIDDLAVDIEDFQNRYSFNSNAWSQEASEALNEANELLNEIINITKNL